jgi:hypothetical protein
MKTAQFHPKPAFDADVINVSKIMVKLGKSERSNK